jgi:very-short-patch-repair endonuclease
MQQGYHAHLKGIGCPICKQSKGEDKVKLYLESNKIKFQQQKTFKNCINPNTNYKLRYDFYLPEHNLLIEFDGIQHFRPSTFNGKIDKEQTLKLFEQTKFTDNIKNNYARENNIRLLRIPYTKFSSINKIISSYLNQLDQT